MITHLDHIVIAAKELEQGAEYVNELFGVDIGTGGRHEIMGTHNKVMALGENVYLEVIAINPDMKAPDVPRWFGLDDPHILGSLDSGPKLLTWAVRTANLEQLVDDSAVPIGQIWKATRDDLTWKVAISEDGRLPGAGFIPLCMQWLVDFHPAERMQQAGCQFRSLTLVHPRPDWLAQSLDSIDARELVTIRKTEQGCRAYIELVLDTPNGEITLSSQ